MKSAPDPIVPDVLVRLDAAAARRWAVLTRAAFAARRAEIDALNVFPVPDGDTGTNLYLTFDAALDSARVGHEQGPDPESDLDLARTSEAFARALLLTARGNSGVILSQIFRGFADEISATGVQAIDGVGLASALGRADDLAWASVGKPVEGTILSVSRAAAEAGARLAADPTSTLYAVTSAVLDAARVALAATPSQLEALARAGVVDAGGAGYVLLLESLERVVTRDASTEALLGEDPLRRRRGWAQPAGSAGIPRRPGRSRAPEGPEASNGSGVWGASGASAASEAPGALGIPAAPAGPGADLDPEGPAYEVMYLLDGAAAHEVVVLRTTLDALGDSVLVVGDADLWNVHVHVDDVGAAIEAGIAAGRPHRIRVTHFAQTQTQTQTQAETQTRARTPAHPQGWGGHGRPDPDAVAVVACAAGEGLAGVFRGAGAQVVLSGPRRRASAGQLLDAARATRAGSVLLLPNDADTILAANAAASVAHEEGITVRVVPARTAVQGIAALAVFDPRAGLSDNALAMGNAAAATRNGAVTVATRDALTSAGWCRAGDVLGVVDGDVAVVGHDLHTVAGEVVDRLLGSGGELLTVVTGEDATANLGEDVVAAARTRRRDLEVVLLYGGQPVYPLMLGVE